MRAAALGLLLGACASAGPAASVAPVRTEGFPAAGPDRVVAIADDGTRRLLLTEQGATVVRGGAVERSPGPRRWRKAILLPAADGRGTWAAGLDQAGRLWRVRPGVALDEISDRYGLAGDQIRDVAAAGGRLVAFLLDGALAVSDGRRVLRYPAAGARGLAGGGRAAALLFADRVDLLALGPLQDGTTLGPRRTSYPLRDPRALALDARGVLFVAAAGRLYQAGADGVLHALPTGHVDWLAAAGPRLWFGEGQKILLDDGPDGPPRQVQGAPEGTARGFAGAADGSLWILGERPLRLVPDRASAAETRWQETIAPLFARGCAACHRPEGRAGVDLSTAAAWLAARDEILQRVAIARTMPPAGSPLSEDDRAAVRAWAAAAWQSSPH